MRVRRQRTQFTLTCLFLRISPSRNKSVRSARRWMDGFRLSTSWELMEGCARTNSAPAIESPASRSKTHKRVIFPGGLESSLLDRSRETLRQSRQSFGQAPQELANLSAGMAALIVGKSLRRVGQHELIALFDDFATL
jgi:hypothetical protein